MCTLIWVHTSIIYSTCIHRLYPILDAISDHELTTNTPIILCANKQDIVGALPPPLLLSHLAPLDAHTTLPISGVTGEGVERLMDAIVIEAKKGQRAKT
ncbi:hypothetical protein EON63_06350 [archaeon]|nr:MAG: hypothetical protein EON63_06350 [archaeon]